MNENFLSNLGISPYCLIPHFCLLIQTLLLHFIIDFHSVVAWGCLGGNLARSSLFSFSTLVPGTFRFFFNKSLITAREE